MSVSVGQPVPDFSATATDGQTVRLSGLRGRWVVLYFYPRDNTPGCTVEGQQFRDLHDRFDALDAVVFGVSRDSLRSHDTFPKPLPRRLHPWHMIFALPACNPMSFRARDILSRIASRV